MSKIDWTKPIEYNINGTFYEAELITSLKDNIGRITQVIKVFGPIEEFIACFYAERHFEYDLLRNKELVEYRYYDIDFNYEDRFIESWSDSTDCVGSHYVEVKYIDGRLADAKVFPNV